MAFVVTHRLTGIARARSASMLRAGRLFATKLHARSGLTPQERANCAAWLEREVALLGDVHVVLCLGGFAWESALRLRAVLGGAPVPRPKPKFGHGAVADGDSWPLLGCFHPSQQNTFTGKLTPAMMDEVLGRAKTLAWGA